MRVRYVMLVSPAEERRRNALLIKSVIPELELVYADNNKEDIFDVCLDAMLTDPNEYDGVVMMEDDLKLCENFREKFDDVLSKHPNDIVQFFERALAKRPLSRGWQSGGNFCSTVCYYVPAVFTPVFFSAKNRREFREDYFPRRHEPWGYPIDIYIAFVLGKNKMIYWREIPYLVQHLDFKSALGNRSTKRQSKYFIDDLRRKNADKGE